MVWQFQDAKQRFSELVREALEHGPQIVTRHGVEVVVVVPAAAYRAAQQPRRDFAEFLTEGPDLDRLSWARAASCLAHATRLRERRVGGPAPSR